MLDDLSIIKQRDPQDALGVIAAQWQQLKYDFDVTFSPTAEVRNIVLAGMGGSGWPIEYLQSWPGLSLPLEINRTYSVPSYVNENTLFIASSYSGNTEEVISALHEAEGKKAQIVIMASGGQLAAISKAKNLPLYLLPTGGQPRMSSFYFIAAMLNLFEPLGIIEKDSLLYLKKMAEWLKSQITSWQPTTLTSQNPAKQLAQELMGKTVIVYSGPLIAPAAHKLKICMTENSKNLAWHNQYPELNHNEFTGWSGHPLQKPFAIIEIRSNLEHQRVQKRFIVTEKLLSGLRPKPLVIKPIGENVAQQLFWTSMFGDFVSIYLAILNSVNPTPVDLVEKLKVALDE